MKYMAQCCAVLVIILVKCLAGSVMEKTAVTIERKNIIILVCCIAFGAAFIMGADSMGGLPVTDQLLFLLAQAAFVLIPGWALTLSINPQKDVPAFFILSYMLGIGVVIAEYFLFYALGLKDWLLLCMSVVSAISVFVIYKKRVAMKPMRGRVANPAFFVLLGVLLVIALTTAVSNYNVPLEGGRTFIYQDLAWNTGNVASIAHGFPVMDIHVSGLSFGYHFFANAFLAVFQNILGISSYLLNVKLLAIVQAFVLAGGLCLLFSTLFKNKWAAAGASVVAMLCCTVAMQHYMWYAYATPVGMGFSLAAAACFIRFMRNMDSAKLSDGNFITFLILLAVAAGTKSLVAGGVIAGAGIVMLCQIFRRRNVKTMLFAGILTLVVFAGLYVVMVYGTYSPNSLTRQFAATMYAETPEQPAYYTALREALPSLPVTMAKLIAYPLFLLLKYPVTVFSLVMLFVAIILQLRKGAKRGWPLNSGRIKLFLFCGIFVSLAIMSVVSQPGESQVLFLEGTVPLSVFALFYLAMESWGKGKLVRIAVCAITAFALGWGVCVTSRALYADSQNLPSRNNSQETLAQNPYDSISRGEYEAMLWLKQNTPQDAIFATDRHYFAPAVGIDVARYYYYTAFAERQAYLEGYNYISTHEKNYGEIIDQRLVAIDGLLANDPDAAARMKEDGVEYFVASSLISPGYIMDESLGRAVFQNADITVYELK